MCFELNELVFVVELLNVFVVCNSNMILKCKCVSEKLIWFLCVYVKLLMHFVEKGDDHGLLILFKNAIIILLSLKLCKTVLAEYEFPY